MGDLDTAPILIELVGGPADGALYRMPRLGPIQIAGGPDPITAWDLDGPAASPIPLTGTYEPTLDPHLGRPSLTDDGRYLFTWRGWS